MEQGVSKLADSNARAWSLLEQVRRNHIAGGDRPCIDPEFATITVSREFGAGGHSVMELVVKALGEEWQTWDRQIVEEIAKSANVRTQLAESLDERMHSKAERMIRYLTNYWSLSPERFHTHLVEVIVNASNQGHKVIIGRGANFILPLSFKVRLFASEKRRVENTVKRLNVSPEEALAKVKSTDWERAEYVRELFHKDIRDPRHYDVSLNMDNLTFEEAAAVICAGVEAHMHRLIRAVK